VYFPGEGLPLDGSTLVDLLANVRVYNEVAYDIKNFNGTPAASMLYV
jgi:hypothetical protein